MFARGRELGGQFLHGVGHAGRDRNPDSLGGLEGGACPQQAGGKQNKDGLQFFHGNAPLGLKDVRAKAASAGVCWSGSA